MEKFDEYYNYIEKEIFKTEKGNKPKSDSEKDSDEEKRKTFLHKFCMKEVFKQKQKDHYTNFEQLFNMLTSSLVMLYHQAQERNDVKEHEDIDFEISTNIIYLWKIFSVLVQNLFSVSYNCIHKKIKHKFVNKILEFASDCYKIVLNQSVSVISVLEWNWIIHYFKYLQITCALVKISGVNKIEFAEEILPKILEIFNYTEKLLASLEEVEKAKGKLAYDFIYPSLYSTLIEGVNYSNSKIFETSHPYARGEVVQKENYHFSKAVAVQVYFDKRCQCDSNSDSIQISTSDQSTWFSNTYGTLFRTSGKPHTRTPIILLGNRVTVDFRSISHGSHKVESKAEEMINRWGYKVTISPIYTESAFVYKHTSKSLSKSNTSSNTVSLIPLVNRLADLVGVMTRTLIRGTNKDISEIEGNSVTKWNIFKGGLNNDNLDPKKEGPILEYLSMIKSGDGIVNGIKKIREFVPYPMFYNQFKGSGKLAENVLEEWNYVENLQMLVLLYHSGMIEDVMDYVRGEMEPEEFEKEEKLKLIAQNSNSILQWMHKKSQAEREFQFLISELLKEVDDLVTKKIENKIEEMQKKEDEKKKQEEEKKEQLK
jgi:hypothetical protein